MVRTGLPIKYPFLLPPREADEIGRLGNYRVLRLLGEGGMGYVFLAEDATLCRRVALKVMKSDPDKPTRPQRFFREAQALAKLKHEHLVPVYHAEKQDDTVFYAMELLEGESLEDRLERAGPIDVPEIIRVGKQVASGLAFIHQQGLVHRDVKPANIWLEAPNGRVKILDLGLVREVDDMTGLTQAGIVVGSVGFMSPEQARGAEIDGRSDLFSLGCVLYHLCTRTQAFDGATTIAVLTALAVSDPRPVRELNADIPPGLAKLIMELLEKKPSDRPASADEVRERLERLAERLATAGTQKPAETARVRTRNASRERDRDRDRDRERPRRTKIDTSRPARTMLILGTAGVVGCLLLLGLIVWLAWPEHSASTLAADHPAKDAPPIKAEPGKEEPKPAIFMEEMQYLADLPALSKENWRSAADGDHFGKFKKEGKPAHAIALNLPHDFDGPVSISYSLGKRFTTFQTDVAITDIRPPKGPDNFFKKVPIFKKGDSAKTTLSCTFSVYGDGKLLWKSPEIAAANDPRTCGISVKDVDVLKITLSARSNNRGLHAAWLDAVLRK